MLQLAEVAGQAGDGWGEESPEPGRISWLSLWEGIPGRRRSWCQVHVGTRGWRGLGQSAWPWSRSLMPLTVSLQTTLPSQGPMQRPSRLVFSDVANAIHA